MTGRDPKEVRKERTAKILSAFFNAIRTFEPERQIIITDGGRFPIDLEDARFLIGNCYTCGTPLIILYHAANTDAPRMRCGKAHPQDPSLCWWPQKQRFPTVKAAEAALAEIVKEGKPWAEGLNAYRCGNNDHYHLGHKEGTKHEPQGLTYTIGDLLAELMPTPD